MVNLRRVQRNQVLNKKCYKCGHDRFLATRVLKCSRCGSPETKIITTKNKFGKDITKVVLDTRGDKMLNIIRVEG